MHPCAEIKILNYDDFVETLHSCGFSMGGSNSEGIFALIPWDWRESPPYDTPVRWHTGDPGTDPWEWRIRVLDEQKKIAYSKVFFKKSGYITKEWYPYFFAVRRGGKSLEETYREGIISREAKRIYDVLQEAGTLPLPIIKQEAGFSGEDKAGFDRAVVELQMGMFITMFGRQQKVSQSGEEYGWSSTVFGLVEQFWDKEVFEQAAQISRNEAVKKISEQAYLLNPEAKQKKVQKLITG